MRKILVLVVCCVAVSVLAQPGVPALSQVGVGQSSGSSSSEEIVTMEQKFWDLLVARDYHGLENLLSPDFVSVASKVRDRAAFLDDIQVDTNDCRTSPVQVNNPQVKLVSPDVATIAYSEVIASTCKDREIKIRSTAITVWVRRDGIWRMHLRSQLFANGFAVQGN